MRSNADLIRLHADLRKTAFEAVAPSFLDRLKQHKSPLTGMLVGTAVAKPGDQALSTILGAVGGATHGMTGALVAPAALAMYRHLTTPDYPEQGHGHR